MIIKDKCSLCKAKIREIVNLGSSPPANNFLSERYKKTISYPLILDFCDSCKGLQLRHCLDKEQLYTNYSYLTPDSSSLNKHYEVLVNFLVSKKFLNQGTNCLEIGSNNGQLLDFLKPRVNSVLGVDPAENVASIANEKGIKTVVDFFSEDLAVKLRSKGGMVDLLIARHMFAHNPDPDHMFKGIDLLLKKKGIILIENAYAFDTFKKGEFDQIYHEHMFYFSVQNMKNYLNSRGYDLNEIIYSYIHGGSMVFIGSRKGKYPISKEIQLKIHNEEEELRGDKLFHQFKQKIENTKEKTLQEIQSDINKGKKVCAYGAPAKAFTMFSVLELNNEKINFCVDTSETKIGKTFPLFNIPIISEEEMQQQVCDTFLVNAWNYKSEILEKSNTLFKSKTKLIFPLPDFEIVYT